MIKISELYNKYQGHLVKYAFLWCLILITLAYVSDLVTIFKRYYNNETVIMLYPRVISSIVILTIIFIIFYYLIIRQHFNRNLLFVLLGLIVLYETSFMIIITKIYILHSNREWHIYISRLLLAGILLIFLGGLRKLHLKR